MARRYGRNQKRAARQKIAELEAAVSALEKEVHNVRVSYSRKNYELQRRLESHKAEAMKEFMEQKDLIEDVMKFVSSELLTKWSEEARPIVDRLVDQMRRQSRTPRLPIFDARVEPVRDENIIIRGHLPAFEYNFVVFDRVDRKRKVRA
jgi:hypothetical protein